MPITVKEKWESRSQQIGSSNFVDRLYVVLGSDDDAAIRTELNNQTADLYGGLIKNDISIERIGEQEWLGKVRYSALVKVAT